MDTLNRGQARAYEAQILALWKTNKILIDTLRAVQTGRGPAFAEKQEWGIQVNGGAAMTDRPMARTGGMQAAQ
jgi:hypothetical protein